METSDPATDFAPEPVRGFRWGVGIEGSAIPHLGVSQYEWTGHDRRWRSDLETIHAALGPCWLRYPIPWERIQPHPAEWRWEEIEQRLEYANELGFRVVAGLVHFGTPTWLPQAFGDPDFPQAIAAYAEAFARRLDPLVHGYIPVNEPVVTALFAGDVGLWPPFGRGWRSYTCVLGRIAAGLLRATKAIRRVSATSEVGFVEAVEHHRSVEPCLEGDVERRNLRRFIVLDLVSGRVTAGHPLRPWLVENGFSEFDLEWFLQHATQPDWLGLDYYLQSETEVWVDEGLIRQKPSLDRHGFASLAAEYYERYGWPIQVTETNAAGDDGHKSGWLYDLANEVACARRDGVPVEGLFWWPAFDHLDWDGAMLHRTGHIHPVGLWRLRGGEEEALEIEETALVAAFAGLAADGEIASQPSNPRTVALAPALPEMETPVVRDGVPIIVHSHLRWAFVWQRPQQIHSRLAERHPILFLEEPVWLQAGEPERLDLQEAHPGVVVAQPRLSFSRRHDTDDAEAVTAALLSEALQGPLARFRSAAHWLYTPQMIGQVAAFPDPLTVIYDCMDELAQFAGAPPQLIEREALLLERADLVLTGGYELFLAKSRRHPNVHFFGCGVDFDHFHAAASALDPPPDLAFVPRPRLGYIGVLDERLDYSLLRALSDARPDWSIVMIGPVVKVDPAALPRPRNIYYLGPRPYAELPRYLAGIDICLMPFALNEATEFINPTKTLEYLATGRPVVSTPIRDVVRNFGQVVSVARADAFPDAVEAALSGQHRQEAGLAIARQSSWETIVARMEELLEGALERKRSGLELSCTTI